MDVTLETVDAACRDVAYAMGVVVLHQEYLVCGLFRDWDGVSRTRRTYRYAVTLVERWTTAEEFRALEFAQRAAAYLDVELRPMELPHR